MFRSRTMYVTKFACLAQILIYLLIKTSNGIELEIEGKEFDVVGYFEDLTIYDEENAEKLDVICSMLTVLVLVSVEVDKEGGIVALERFPSDDRLKNLHSICAEKYGVKLLVSFGGQSRANGFADVVPNPEKRKKFINNVENFLSEKNLDGVDWNWEYPSNEKEWRALKNLTKEMRTENPSAIQTIKYFPDGIQEITLGLVEIADDVDLLHVMAYDISTPHHSSYEYATASIERALEASLPREKLVLGLPMYAINRDIEDWKPYSDICETQDKPCKNKRTKKVNGYSFNSVYDIQRKSMYAFKEAQIGGVFTTYSSMDTRNADLHKAIADTILGRVDLDKEDAEAEAEDDSCVDDVCREDAA